MAENRGGYRQPRNPAPVSGPGALSKRTDGGAIDGMTPPQTQAPKYMAGLGYGEGGNMAQQSGAPMVANDIPAVPKPVVPLFAPTQRPTEPVTTGVNVGPGAGSEVITLPNTTPDIMSTIKKAMMYDNSGDMEMIYRNLADSGF